MRRLLPVVFVVALMACLPKTPPAVFVDPVAPADPPNLKALPEVRDNECHGAVAYVPGRVPPFVVDGKVTCTGLVVPESQVYLWRKAEKASTFWEEQVRICQRHREADRGICTGVADARWRDGEVLRRELQWRRAATGAGIVAGVILGVAVGSVLP